MIFMFLILINVAFSKTKNNNVLIFTFDVPAFCPFENNNRFCLNVIVACSGYGAVALCHIIFDFDMLR